MLYYILRQKTLLLLGILICFTQKLCVLILLSIKVLTFMFNRPLDSKHHIIITWCKAYSVLGFVKRLAYDFKLGLSLKCCSTYSFV